MKMSVSKNHPFVEKIQIVSTLMEATSVSVMKDLLQLQLRLNVKTSTNVWSAALIVVLMQNVSILKEVIIARVKLATFPAMEKRYSSQDKEFIVLTEMNATTLVFVENMQHVITLLAISTVSVMQDSD